MLEETGCPLSLNHVTLGKVLVVIYIIIYSIRLKIALF